MDQVGKQVCMGYRYGDGNRNGHHNNCRRPGSLEKDSEWRPACRMFIGKYSQEQHLQSSEGSRAGQTER